MKANTKAIAIVTLLIGLICSIMAYAEANGMAGNSRWITEAIK